MFYNVPNVSMMYVLYTSVFDYGIIEPYIGHWWQRTSSNEQSMVSNCTCYICKYYYSDISVIMYYRLVFFI